jgi:hypothetical protein
MILSFCDQKSSIDCIGSIIFLALINRLMPYVIAILAQVEEYKYLSYKLDVVGYRFVFNEFKSIKIFCYFFRCIFLNICTILSFTIYFFTHTYSCYETIYGQYMYILLLAGRMNSKILIRKIIENSFRFICIINFSIVIRFIL